MVTSLYKIIWYISVMHYYTEKVGSTADEGFWFVYFSELPVQLKTNKY